MSEELTKAMAVDRLLPQEAYQYILQDLELSYQAAIDELRDIPADKLQQKAGEITAYKDILANLSG